MCFNFFWKKSLVISLLLFLGLSWESQASILPVSYAFKSLNVDCEGNLSAELMQCASLDDGIYKVSCVDWFVCRNNSTGGTCETIRTTGMNLAYTFLESGSFDLSVSANVYVLYDDNLYGTTALINCTSTSTTWNKSVVIYEPDIYTFSQITGPETVFYGSQGIQLCFSATGNLDGWPSAVCSLYVDDAFVRQLSPLPGMNLQCVPLPPDLCTEGQHTAAIVFKNIRECSPVAHCTFDVLPLASSACATSCLTFQPLPNERYWTSAWVKVASATPLKTYNGIGSLDISYIGSTQVQSFNPTGEIIDGWQRIVGDFTVPSNVSEVTISLKSKGSQNVFFDDVRIHPYNASMKSYVYDPGTFWLMAELDDNNFATYYEYDKEGKLIRTKKETERGVMTIQETRSKNPKR